MTRDPSTPAETVADPEGDPRPSVLADLSGQVGRYTVLERLGAGGMGAVYAAYDPQLDRRVALKLLHGGNEPTSSGRQSTAHARLLREAQAIAKVSHPNVIHVYDVGTVEIAGERSVFVAMEIVQGRTLRAFMEELHASAAWKRGERTGEIVALMLQAAKGLEAAHAAGLVHRDFKPDNVLVGDDGIVRVVDFGLARRVDDPRARTEASAEPPGDVSLERITMTGAVLGTPAYMAPEQFRGGPVDGRTDQFAFCLTLYELLFGVRPFRSGGSHGLAVSVMAGELRPRPAEPPVPDEIVRVVERGLAAKADDRFASMQAIIAALAHDREGAAAQRRRRLAYAGIGVLGAAAVAWALQSRERATDPCALGDARIEEVWNEARASELRATVDADAPTYAARTLAATTGVLDRYAEAWADSYRDACEATHVRRTQSESMLELRSACLDRRRAALDAAVTELVTEDAPVEHAMRVATGLPPVTACADVAALQADVPPPADAEAAQAVAEVRAELEKVDVKLELSRHGDALALARELKARADAIGYPPLQAEVAYATATSLATTEEHAATVEAYRDALLRAQAAGVDAIVRDASAGLAIVLGTDLARPEDGLLWSDLAQATAERIGWTPHERAELLRSRAFILVEWGGHQDDAIEMVEQARKAALEAYGPDSYEMIDVYSSLGAVYGRLQRFPEAEDAFRRAVEIGEAVMGADHPSMISAYRNLGNALSAQHRIDEARENLEKALELTDRLPAVPADDKATILNSLGNLLLNEKRHAEAREMLERALKLREEVYGPDHPIVARTLNSLGNAALHMGDTELARADYLRALKIRETALGADHPGLLTPLNNLGSLHVKLERYDEAIEYFRRADAILAAHPGDAIAETDHHYWYGRALVESRRDLERGNALVDAAITQGREIGRDGFVDEVQRWRASLAR